MGNRSEREERKRLKTRQEVGEQLKSIREAKNMTHKDISDATGLSARQIIRIEQGAHSFGIDQLLKFIEALERHLEIPE